MKYCMITFRSVTPAQRGEEALRRAGISCTLSRTPRKLEEQGCGYCLRLPRVQLAIALGRLMSGGISYQRVYEISEQGKWEEVRL
jgi:hypothetical protein